MKSVSLLINLINVNSAYGTSNPQGVCVQRVKLFPIRLIVARESTSLPDISFATNGDFVISCTVANVISSAEFIKIAICTRIQLRC